MQRKTSLTCIRGGTRTATDFPYHSVLSCHPRSSHPALPALPMLVSPPPQSYPLVLPPSPPILLGATMERLTRSSPRQPSRPSTPLSPFAYKRARASLPFPTRSRLSLTVSIYVCIYHFGGRSVSHPWQCIPHLLPFPSAMPSSVPSPRRPRPPPLAPLHPPLPASSSY